MANLYPWQHEQWRSLMLRKRQASMPHALLLAGAAGLGKQDFALTLVAAMLCLQPDQHGVACGQCKNCALLLVNNHPDFYLLCSEGDDKPIKVDQVRYLTQFLLTTPQIASLKIAVVYQADSMNLAAANALLKTLEEPEGNSLLILISNKPGMLLATIRSRCQLVPFTSTDSARQWLAAQLPQFNTDILLAISDGGPLSALAMAEQLPILEQTIGNLVALASHRLSLSAAISACQKIPLQNLLAWSIHLVSDIIKLHVTQTERFVVLRMDLSTLKKLAFAANLTSLYNYLDQLLALQKQLLSKVNVNQQLLLERTLYLWQLCWMEMKSCP
jgi:DNA polymerase-3 subunit delta'